MKLQLKPGEHRGLLIVGDLTLAMVSGLVALLVWAVKDGRVVPGPFALSRLYWVPLLAGLWVVLALLNGFYDLQVAGDPKRSAFALLRIAGLELAIYVIVYFFWPPERDLPRGTVLYHAGASFVLVGLWRTFYRPLSRRAFRRRAIVVGAGRAGRTIVQTVRNNEGAGLELLGFVDDDPDKADQTFEGLPVMGSRDDMVTIVERADVSQVILAITHHLHDGLFRALMDCNEQGVEITPMPVLYEELTGKVPVEHVGDNWLAVLPLEHPAVHGFFPLVKRAFDMSVSAAGLAFLGVLFPFLALAVYLDSPGAVLYRQERVGKGGRRFSLLKFRTMVPEAEREGQAVWARERDPRVTRVGRLLRATHLDEFPQFYNIFRGDMSVVGPRPERPAFVAELEHQIPFYRLRHAVKPGMAGWALVNHGYSGTVEDAMIKVQYDLYYIKHQSIYLDLLILYRTLIDMIALGGR